MRKVMLLAAMLAMVLAAAAPAFAQATAVEYGNDTDNSVNVNDSICTNVSQVAAQQYNAGDQNAASVEGDATNIANTLGISVAQVNDCLNFQGGEDFDKFGKTVVATTTATADGGAGGGGGGGGSASAAAGGGTATAAAEGELPSTGGASVLALGAGVLLVAGGLVARRIVR